MCRFNFYRPKDSDLRSGYEADNGTMPVMGHLMADTVWHGKPVCVVELDSLGKCKYSDVSAEFSCLEGEGDPSLEGWRKECWEGLIHKTGLNRI
jgi:uncharacterized protein YhfF